MIGVYIYPFLPVGSVAMCIALFLINTEQKFLEFIRKISIKENYRFKVDRKKVQCISAESGSWFSVFSNKAFAGSSGKFDICTVLGWIYIVLFWVYSRNKWKEGWILFNQRSRRSNCGLIIHGMFDVHGEIMENNFMVCIPQRMIFRE